MARGGGRTSYRGLIQINEGAHGSKSNVLCDALLVDQISRTDTYPYVDIREDDVSMGHEATVSKVSDDQLFYLMSRGMEQDEAMAMIVRGFVEPIAKELPDGVRPRAQPAHRAADGRRGRLMAPAGDVLSVATSHPVGSFDLSDHPVPTGREEIWRFTPLKRLRGLHDDAPLTGDAFDVKVEAPEGIRAESVPVAESERGLSGYVPTDRVSARVWEATPSVFTIEVPREVEVSEPVFVTVTGHGGEDAIARQLLVKIGTHAKATVVMRFQGAATFADNVEIVVGDGAQLTVRHRPGLGRRRGPPQQPARAGRPRRLAQARRGHLRRRPGAP